MVNLDACQSRAQQWVAGKISSGNDVTLQALEIRFQELALEVQASLSGGRMNTPEFNRYRAMKRQIAKRSRAVAAVSVAAEVEVAESEKPAELVWYDTATRSAEPEIVSVDDVVRKSLEDLNRTDTAFENDIRKIIEYLRNADMSAGVIRGIKKIQDLKASNSRFHAIWEFKPLEAHGLSTSTKEGYNIRVLFTVPNEGQIGLIRVLQKQNVAKEILRIKRNLAGNY